MTYCNRRLCISCVLAFLVWILLFCSSACGKETIRLAVGEWAPYQSEVLEYGGVGHRIVTEAFALEGIEVEYEYLPWKRSHELTKNGKFDGTCLWNITEERKKFFYYSDPVVVDESVFFHLKSYDFVWKSFDDLKNVRVGATLGYIYADEFIQAEQNGTITVERATSDAMNFKKLLGGRFDIFICNTVVGYEAINSMYDPATAALFTHHPRPIQANLLRLLMTKKNPENMERVARFNRGLKKLKASGVLEKYMKESSAGMYKR